LNRFHFLPIYDLVIKNLEKDRGIADCFWGLCNNFNPELFPVTFLLPEQYAYEPTNSNDSIEEFIRAVYKRGYRCKEIYLPTLYGPWQPKEYFFHHSILPLIFISIIFPKYFGP